jgi:hypothetical protein
VELDIARDGVTIDTKSTQPIALHESEFGGANLDQIAKDIARRVKDDIVKGKLQ